MPAVTEPASSPILMVLIESLRELFTGVTSKPNMYSAWKAQPTWNFALQPGKWQGTQAPLSFLQILHDSRYRSAGMRPNPSAGSKSFDVPNLISGFHIAQVTWTQLLPTVRFSGSRGP